MECDFNLGRRDGDEQQLRHARRQCDGVRHLRAEQLRHYGHGQPGRWR